MGEESVPVQVDGEAWLQPPGYIRIVHKNRAQMLTRDKVPTLTLPFKDVIILAILNSLRGVMTTVK